MGQSELIRQLSDKELNKQLIFSQLLFIVLSFILSYFLFSSMRDWSNYFRWDIKEIIYFGAIPGFFITGMDLILMKLSPANYYDDGGINKRIFRNRSISSIFGITLLIAIAEELLFRGVIQTVFGYILASVLFSLVHFRYLKKPVLLISILLVSFYIGYMYVLTSNLITVITAHFIIDFLLGLLIRFQSEV